MNGKKIGFVIGFILFFVAHLLDFDKKFALFASQTSSITWLLCIVGLILLHFLVLFICNLIAKATNNRNFFVASIDALYVIYLFVLMIVLLLSLNAIVDVKSIYYKQQNNIAESSNNLVVKK